MLKESYSFNPFVIFFHLLLGCPTPSLINLILVTYFDPKVTGSLVTRLGPIAQSSTWWSLNREPSNCECNALTHQATIVNTKTRKNVLIDASCHHSICITGKSHKKVHQECWFLFGCDVINLVEITSLTISFHKRKQNYL